MFGKRNKIFFAKIKKGYAGIALTLSKDKHPDLSSFSDSEVCFRVPLEYHAGLIVKSEKQERVFELLEEYGNRLATDFTAIVEQVKVDKLH